jgi:hypothetical protein
VYACLFGNILRASNSKSQLFAVSIPTTSSVIIALVYKKGKEDAKKQLFSSSNHRIIIIYCIMGDNSTEISARGSSSGTMFACTFCEQLAVVTTL